LAAFGPASAALAEGEEFENGFIVLVPPEWYFGRKDPDDLLAEIGLTLGENAVVFYETRTDWTRYPPPKGWTPAERRRAPLRGQYVARVPATTALRAGDKTNEGFTTSANKGAGIRVYEYASQF